jgi:hypothetical protein
MDLKIEKAYVSNLFQIAIGFDNTDFDKYIREAIEFDIQELFCEEFFYKIFYSETDNPEITKLLEGGSYEYESKIYNFRGLKDVIAYFTYARFVMNSNVSSTSHGFVHKVNPHSEALSFQERKDYKEKNRIEANKLFAKIQLFLERNIDQYPIYKRCIKDCKPKSNRTFKTHVIQ